MSGQTHEEQKRDAYLFVSGWLPIDKDNLSGLWSGKRGNLRQAEAVAAQTEDHAMMVVSWYMQATKEERSVVSGIVFSLVIAELQELASDSDVRGRIAATLGSDEAREALAEVGRALKPLIKSWLSEDE